MGATTASAFSFQKFTTGQKYLRTPPRPDCYERIFQVPSLILEILVCAQKKALRTVELLFVPVCFIFFSGKKEVVSNAVTHQSPCHFFNRPSRGRIVTVSFVNRSLLSISCPTAATIPPLPSLLNLFPQLKSDVASHLPPLLCVQH